LKSSEHSIYIPPRSKNLISESDRNASLRRLDSKIRILRATFGALFCVSLVLAAFEFSDGISHLAIAESGADDIAIQSFNSTGDQILSIKTQRLTLLVLWVLVVGIIAVGLLSPSSHLSIDRLIRLGKGPDASNLFLGVQYSDSTRSGVANIGYMRSLGMNNASFVADHRIERSETVRFDFASLPGFSGTDNLVQAQVVRCRPIEGDSKNFLIEVRFSSVSDSVRSALAEYLVQLTSPRSAYNRV
jgi:hypothetical protein